MNVVSIVVAPGRRSPSPRCNGGRRWSPKIRSTIERATRQRSAITLPRVVFSTRMNRSIGGRCYPNRRASGLGRLGGEADGDLGAVPQPAVSPDFTAHRPNQAARRIEADAAAIRAQPSSVIGPIELVEGLIQCAPFHAHPLVPNGDAPEQCAVLRSGGDDDADGRPGRAVFHGVVV